MRHLTGLVLLFAVSTGCAANDPPKDPGCASDADCPPDTSCAADGACRASDGGGGGGAGGAGVPACARSDDCLTAPFPLIPEFHWDGQPGVDRVCTLPPARCPAGDLCEVELICAEVSTDAERPGAFRCEHDEECWSGRCLPFGDGKLCARLCSYDGDCPFTTGADGERLGLSCQTERVEGITVQRCVPVPGAPPGTSLCRSARECGPGQECRFHGDPALVPLMPELPLCVEARGGRPTLSRCGDDASSCAGGSCSWPCDGGTGDPGNLCRSPPYRCTAPCALDADCPARAICGVAEWQNRVGSFPPPPGLEANMFGEGPGRDVRHCLLARPGCFDEQDCCPDPQPDGSCRLGWERARGRCGVTLQGPPDGLRLLTLCRPIDGRAAPGDCCAAHADCDSDLCVPARAEGACAGGSVCSVPCDPDPDPDGVPGSGDERDRCALVASTGDYHAGSRCEPLLYEADGVSVSVQVCR